MRSVRSRWSRAWCRCARTVQQGRAGAHDDRRGAAGLGLRVGSWRAVASGPCGATVRAGRVRRAVASGRLPTGASARCDTVARGTAARIILRARVPALAFGGRPPVPSPRALRMIRSALVRRCFGSARPRRLRWRRSDGLCGGPLSRPGGSARAVLRSWVGGAGLCAGCEGRAALSSPAGCASGARCAYASSGAVARRVARPPVPTRAALRMIRSALRRRSVVSGPSSEVGSCSGSSRSDGRRVGRRSRDGGSARARGPAVQCGVRRGRRRMSAGV